MGQPQASPAPDAALGPAGDLPTAPDVSAAPRAPDLPIPAARPGDHAAESGVVFGRDVHFAGARLSLPGRGHGLGEPEGLSLEAVKHARLSSFCVEALHEALDRYGSPEIFNTDQGSQFTSLAFTDGLTDAGIHISMDGKGRWMDNVVIERLWRALKYEQVYLAEYATASDARAGIGWWIEFYNERRPHSSLVDRTPNEAYNSGGYSGTGALPRPITARGGLTYDPGLHLNLAAELSEGWGPPLYSSHQQPLEHRHKPALPR